MCIVYEEQFGLQFKVILGFIARDNPTAAHAFRGALKRRIEKIPDNPLACRQSRYFTDPNLRDMIFIGYTAIYRVTTDEIRMLDIFKWQDR